MKKTEKETETPAQQPGPAGVPEPLIPAETATLNGDQIEELKQRAAKAEENWDRLLRTTADFDNFRKRAQREKQEAVKFANESLLQKLIPVLDSFDMALAAAQNAPNRQEESLDSLQQGVSMVFQQLKKALVDAGLEEVDGMGKPFDPNLHEAVAQKETADVAEGTVVQQLRKGYKLRERLLRPASVIVAKHPA